MKYPIGLPVRDNGSGIIYFVHSHGKVAGVVNVIDEHGNVFGWAISLLTPLTEAEYFAEVMEPQGWVEKESNGLFFGYRKLYQKDELSTGCFACIEKDRPYINFMPTLDRDVIRLQSSALDHYEALTAIKNYTP